MPFSTTMPITRTNNNVQQKLAALTLRLEKELESESTVGEYYGQCTKCGLPVTGSSDACQALGELYHNDCFKCIVCARILRGKIFYRIHDQVYCEEDYLVRNVYIYLPDGIYPDKKHFKNKSITRVNVSYLF
jgi:LIM domain-containing protein